MISVNEVATMKKTFDDYKHIDENGREFWYAHELSKAMGYSNYRNFNNAIERAKAQMVNTGKNPDDHLVGSDEMVSIGSGAIREIEGYKMDKYASYIVAMNADPHKEEVAFAQQYFLNNTAKVEYLQKRISDKAYIDNRDKLKLANTKLAATLLDHDVKESEIGIAMSKGDEGMFDMPTKEVKEFVGISNNKPLGDILGEDLAIIKTAAQVLSKNNIIKEDARGLEETSEIIYDNNRIMRNLVIDNMGDVPENLIPQEDVKKVESHYKKETSKLLKKLEEEEF